MINLFVLSVTATEDLSAYTVCRFDGGYDGTTPYLGVVNMDVVSGAEASVTTLGLGKIKIATGETIAVGEVAGIDATGMAVANASGNKVADFKPALFSEGGYVYVIL